MSNVRNPHGSAPAFDAPQANFAPRLSKLAREFPDDLSPAAASRADLRRFSSVGRGRNGCHDKAGYCDVAAHGAAPLPQGA